jgi:nucleoside-diphosphate-sugar epimerase
VIYGDGSQSRDLTFVSDVVRANLLAAGAPDHAWGKVYNVAPGNAITINDLARAVLEAFGGGREPLHVEPRPEDIVHSRADSSLARVALGFAAEVPVDAGIRKMARHALGTHRT